jgi:hypothetical protein
VHGIQAALEVLLQARGGLAVGLLGAGVLGAPGAAGLGDGDGGALGGGLLTGLDADVLAEAVDLVEDHLAHLADVLDDLEVEVEGGGAAGLVRGVVPDVQVRVLERRLHGDPGRRVECQHVVEEVERVGVGVGEERLEAPLGHEGQVADVLLGPGRTDAGQRLLVGRAKDMEDLVELINVVSALEERASTEQLREDAPYRPDIDCTTLEEISWGAGSSY